MTLVQENGASGVGEIVVTSRRQEEKENWREEFWVMAGMG